MKQYIYLPNKSDKKGKKNHSIIVYAKTESEADAILNEITDFGYDYFLTSKSMNNVNVNEQSNDLIDLMIINSK